jgi:hypothetical protein
MSYVKIATVVKRLHDKTNRGDVRWEQTSKEGSDRILGALGDERPS